MPSPELPGIRFDAVATDAALVARLDADHMLKLPVVPATVLGAVLPPDEAWLRMDATYPGQMRERFTILRTHRSKVIDRVDTPQVRAAETELRDRVVAYLLRRHPAYFRQRGSVVSSPLTGVAVDLAEADPMAAVAALHNSDFLLMLPMERSDDGGQHGKPRQRVYRLLSGALLAPNGWSLRSHFDEPQPSALDADAHAAWLQRRAVSLRHARLGKSVQEIHADRVPHYDRHLRDPVHRMFNALRADRVVWRRNWALPMTDALFLHADVAPPPMPEPTPEQMLRHGFVRSEQQTFLRLAGSRAIVFGVHTYVWPLREVLAHPDTHRALRTAHANLSPEMRDYRATALAALGRLLDTCLAPDACENGAA